MCMSAICVSCRVSAIPPHPHSEEVTLLLETKSKATAAGPGVWPRDRVLNRWRADLRVGDCIDALDPFNVWYESVSHVML